MYLDKNYGGILILWDRLFGTFVEEQDSEPVVSGTRSPLRNWNPLLANLDVYRALWFDTRHTTRWCDRARIWLARPGWRPTAVAARWPAPPFDIRRSLYHRKHPVSTVLT